MEEKKQDVISLLGIEPVVIEDKDDFIIEYKLDERHNNRFGTIHGGVLYIIMDDALMKFEARNEHSGMGCEGIVHYYRAVKAGDTVRVRMTLRKDGRKMGFYLAEAKSLDGKLLCDCVFDVVYA